MRPVAPFLVGLGTGVLLTLLGTAIAGSGAPPAAPLPEKKAAEPAPTAAPVRVEPEKPSVDARLRQIEETIRDDSGFSKRSEILRMIDDLRASAGPRSEDLDRLRAEYARGFETAAARLADFARSEAERLAAKTRLDEALRKCDDYLESFGSSSHAISVRQLRDDLDRRRRR